MADLMAGRIPKATAATVIGDSAIDDQATAVVLTLTDAPSATVSGSVVFDLAYGGGYIGGDATTFWIGTTANPIVFYPGDTPALTLAADLSARFEGNIIQTPSASVTPATNGDLMVQATSNTQITFKLKGSDGVVRSGSITLA